MEMCQPVSNVSGPIAVYFPQPAVIWLSREPKRQPTDLTVV